MTIRKQPADFRVREVLVDAESGPFPLYELTKESLTTPEAIAKLARALAISAADCAYAGLKDKHALTTQSVTVRAEGQSLPEQVGEDRWSARRVGSRSQPLSARDIARNEFEIILRDLTRESSDAMDAAAAQLRVGDSLRVLNFFGDQRFGSARHGEGFAARFLVRGEFEQALRLLIATPHRKDTGVQRAFTRTLANAWGDWPTLARDLPRCPNRRAIELLASRATPGPSDFKDAFASLPYMLQEIAVDAYQSFLWNLILEKGAASDSSSLVGSKVALPSPSATYNAPFADAASEVFANDGTAPADLRIPGLRRPAFRHADRAAVVEASQFTMLPPQPDELAPPRGRKAPPRFQRTARFSLPSGSYATVVLRALGH